MIVNPQSDLKVQNVICAINMSMHAPEFKTIQAKKIQCTAIN